MSPVNDAYKKRVCHAVSIYILPKIILSDWHVNNMDTSLGLNLRQ